MFARGEAKRAGFLGKAKRADGGLKLLEQEKNSNNEGVAQGLRWILKGGKHERIYEKLTEKSPSGR